MCCGLQGFATAPDPDMLCGFNNLESLLPDAMRAPDVSLSSAQSRVELRQSDRGRPILDPRYGDAEDDVSSPKQKSLLAIAGRSASPKSA